jgi:hypothetical protein
MISCRSLSPLSSRSYSVRLSTIFDKEVCGGSLVISFDRAKELKYRTQAMKIDH